MGKQYYLRIENNSFSILEDRVHQITEKDILITNDDYNKYIQIISKGRNLTNKNNPTGNRLFDYIEESTPEIIEEKQEPGIEEFMLETDFRLSKLELGV